MPQIQQNNPIYNQKAGTPLYNYPNTQQVQQPSVTVSTPTQSQIYNYPQTSLYGQPSKQAASGVNIYIYNPSAIGGPTSNSTANATYTMPGAQNGQPMAQTSIQQPVQMPDVNPNQSVTIANSPISKEEKAENKDDKEKKTKNIVEITDDYVKTLESYIRSADKTVRHNGIKELIKRFEEDDSRYEDPALNALLNIALQDPDASNRLLAISPIASGTAHGDNNTLPLIEKCEQSSALYGQEALLANEAKLKLAEKRVKVQQ